MGILEHVSDGNVERIAKKISMRYKAITDDYVKAIKYVSVGKEIDEEEMDEDPSFKLFFRKEVISSLAVEKLQQEQDDEIFNLSFLFERIFYWNHQKLGFGKMYEF